MEMTERVKESSGALLLGNFEWLGVTWILKVGAALLCPDGSFVAGNLMINSKRVDS